MTMFKDSVNKKMFAIDRQGQYLFDFGIAEKDGGKLFVSEHAKN